jgi:hypothetical protein
MVELCCLPFYDVHSRVVCTTEKLQFDNCTQKSVAPEDDPLWSKYVVLDVD